MTKRKAGLPYIVDENTPNSELWIPDTAGRVLSGDTYSITVPVQGLIPYREPLPLGERGVMAAIRHWLRRHRPWQ